VGIYAVILVRLCSTALESKTLSLEMAGDGSNPLLAASAVLGFIIDTVY
jgi:hypothetical protein